MLCPAVGRETRAGVKSLRSARQPRTISSIAALNLPSTSATLPEEQAAAASHLPATPQIPAPDAAQAPPADKAHHETKCSDTATSHHLLPEPPSHSSRQPRPAESAAYPCRPDPPQHDSCSKHRIPSEAPSACHRSDPPILHARSASRRTDTPAR